MAKVTLMAVREDGKIKIGTWRNETWHYFYAPEGINTKEQVEALIAAQVAKQGKGKDDYTLSFADNV